MFAEMLTYSCTLQLVPEMLRMWDKYQSIPEPFASVVARSPLKLTVHKDKEQILQISELSKLSPKFFQSLHAVSCPCTNNTEAGSAKNCIMYMSLHCSIAQ